MKYPNHKRTHEDRIVIDLYQTGYVKKYNPQFGTTTFTFPTGQVLTLYPAYEFEHIVTEPDPALIEKPRERP